jgi:hypothetical protein
MIGCEDRSSTEYRNAKLTDLEELELRRRLDVARGFLPRAITLFEARKNCKKWVESTEAAKDKELWLLSAMVVLLVAQLFMGKENELTVPGSFAILTLLWLAALRYDRFAANRAEENVQDKLMALSVTFYGASGSWTEFWAIDEFSDSGTSGPQGFDNQDDRIRKWFFRVRLSIVQSICGSDDIDRMHAICTKLCRDYGYDEDKYYWNE